DVLEAEVRTRLAPDAFAEPDLEAAVGAQLVARGWALGVAESCTGGYLAHRMTAHPGSSAFFRGGVVAYHNDIKTGLLNVPPDVLATYGAVSEATVRAMAAGVRQRLGTEVGVATSGVAGPGGGTPDKPVGTVWIAVATPERTEAHKLQLTSERDLNIELTAVRALNLVRRMLGTR
ncbi:MAG: nicotinamide-nucleotide amidohydrolase family protein, partial [Catalinimonas sp.]